MTRLRSQMSAVWHAAACVVLAAVIGGCGADGKGSADPARPLEIWLPVEPSPADKPIDSCSKDSWRKHLQGLSSKLSVRCEGATIDRLRRNAALLRTVSAVAARENQEVRVQFVSWAVTAQRFESAMSNPSAAPDITFVPSTWLVSLAGHLEDLPKQDWSSVPCAPSRGAQANQEQARALEARVAPFVCDVRVFFLWLDLVKADRPERAEQAATADFGKQVDTSREGAAGNKADAGNEIDARDQTDARDEARDDATTDKTRTLATELDERLNKEHRWPIGNARVGLEKIARALDPKSSLLLNNDGSFDSVHKFAFFLCAQGGSLLEGTPADSGLGNDEQLRKTLALLGGLARSGHLRVEGTDINTLHRRFGDREAGMIMGRASYLLALYQGCNAKPSDLSSEGAQNATKAPAYCAHLNDLRLLTPDSSVFAGGSYLGLWDRARTDAQQATATKVVVELTKAVGETADVRRSLHDVGFSLPGDFSEPSEDTKADQEATNATKARKDRVSTQNFDQGRLALRESAYPYPLLPEWRTVVESPAVVLQFSALWNHIGDEQLSMGDLKTVHQYLHERLAWWPRNWSWVLGILAGLLGCAAGALCWLFVSRRRIRESRLLVGLSADGFLAMARAMTAQTHLLVQGRDLDAAKSRLEQLLLNLRAAREQLQAMADDAASEPRTVEADDLLRITSALLPFTLRWSTETDAPARTMVCIRIPSFVEAMVFLAPLLKLASDGERDSTCFVVATNDEVKTQLVLSIALDSAEKGTYPRLPAEGPDYRRRVSRAKRAIHDCAPGARLIETSAAPKHVELHLPRYISNRAAQPAVSSRGQLNAHWRSTRPREQ